MTKPNTPNTDSYDFPDITPRANLSETYMDSFLTPEMQKQIEARKAALAKRTRKAA